MFSANGGNVIFHFKGDDSDLKNTKNGVEGLTKSMIISTGVTKALSAGFNMITNSMDSAISRYDTMNNFPRVMSNLGIASKDAEASIALMNEVLIGLPTTLDQGAMAVQRFTSANGDVGKSTKLFLAVNNAILAGGASAEIQSSALEQLSQAYAKGKPDMMEWRTLMTAMPAQLKQVATAMGYVDATALGEDLRKGTITMDDFTDTIMRLNEEGLEGFANFDTQARNATNGISTAMKNMKSRIADGVTEMISAVDKGLKKNGLKGIAPMLENIGSSVRDFLTSLAPMITNVVSFVVHWLPPILNFLKAILPILIPIFASIKAYQITLQAIKVATMLWNTAQMILNGTMMLNPIGLIVAGIVALIAIIAILWTKCEWFRDLVKGLWEGIKTGISIVVETVKYQINKVIETVKNIIKVGKDILIWFGELPAKMINIGIDIVKGIWKGIKNATDWLKNKVSGFVNGITKSITKALGIGSPSKVMAKEIGQWIPKGIAVGITANTSSVEKSMEQLQNATLGAFSVSPSMEHSLHYSPNVVVNNHVSSNTDPLGQTVTQIKTFANGAKNDYNYGMGW